jgi:hypothetical protein
VTQWQPIETVPKNERVLFVAFGEIVYAGEWNEWRKILEPDFWEGPNFEEGRHHSLDAVAGTAHRLARF